MTDFPKYDIIVIGGSWGGLNAIIKILKDIPGNFQIPIVVVLHRLKYFKSDLVEILEKKIRLKVMEVEEKDTIVSGYVYLAPADYHVLVEEDKTFSLCVSVPRHFSRPSIDVTFESVADVYKEKTIGIILTGANKDGSNGLKNIGVYKGVTIIQDPQESEMPVMPRAAIDAVEFPIILKLEAIKEFLLNNEF